MGKYIEKNPKALKKRKYISIDNKEEKDSNALYQEVMYI